KDEITDYIPEEYKDYKRKLELTDDARYKAEDYVPDELKYKRKLELKDEARYKAEDYVPEELKYKRKLELTEDYKDEITDYIPEEYKDYKRKLELKDDARYKAEDFLPYEKVEKEFSEDYKEKIQDYIPEEYKKKRKLELKDTARYAAEDYKPFKKIEKEFKIKEPSFKDLDAERQKDWEESGIVGEVKKEKTKSYFDELQEKAAKEKASYVTYMDETSEKRTFVLEHKKPKEGLLTPKHYRGRKKEADLEQYKKERLRRIELYEFLMLLGDVLLHPEISEDYLIKKSKKEKLEKAKAAPTFLKIDRDLSEEDLKKLKKIEKDIEEEEKKKKKGPQLL
ncbi:MAG: hypothetical protein ACFFDN_19105, partial [Candidatus Hodarchaeota archaeon]